QTQQSLLLFVPRSSSSFYPFSDSGMHVRERILTRRRSSSVCLYSSGIYLILIIPRWEIWSHGPSLLSKILPCLLLISPGVFFFRTTLRLLLGGVDRGYSGIRKGKWEGVACC
ncbi:unnamed protein product, partial [Ectocarpus sp. 12 AP-2014]